MLLTHEHSVSLPHYFYVYIWYFDHISTSLLFFFVLSSIDPLRSLTLKCVPEAGETAHSLEPGLFFRDAGAVPSQVHPPKRWLAMICNSRSRSATLSDFQSHQAHRHTCRQNTHTYKIKILNLKKWFLKVCTHTHTYVCVSIMCVSVLCLCTTCRPT